MCLALALLAILAAAPSAAPAPHPRLAPFPLRDVRLLEGPFRDMQQRGLAYLLSLDPDRLLHTFRLNAGLPTTAKPYGGWEAPQVELRGHSLGHYLTACALAWEATGDERLRTRALAITAELRRVRLALGERGANPGYLSAFPEELFDRVEQRRGVWAPYYTLHKVLAGLLDVHRVFSDPVALEAAKGIATWVSFRAGRLRDAEWQEMLQTEFGGMQESLAGLYAVTGDPEHLRLARLFDHRVVFDPLARGEDPLDGLHANTQIPKAIGAERDCELTGERRYCRVAETFWSKVALGRSYVIGGHSEDEHFFPVAHFSRHLGESTAETCNTYNMLKLSRDLFRRDADPARIDFYERGLFNHILASNDPATGQVTYYVSMKPGAWRTYSTPEDSFWCCVGTGMENPARFGEAIYFHSKDALYVGLFLASEVTWREKGLFLRQETRFPDEDQVRLTIRLAAPVRLTLHVRHPAWVEGDLAVSVNGRRQPAASRPGAYGTIEREWRDGDVVDFRLPMRLRTEPMPDDPSVVAFLQGPIVLAADLGGAGLDAAKRLGPTAPEFREDEALVTPTLVAASTAEALARLHPAGEPLTFRTQGLGRPDDVVLRPFFRLYDRRHAVYLPVVTEASWAGRGAREAAAASARRAAEARTIDAVRAGSAAEETAHAVEAVRADAWSLEGRRCRSTRYGGSFSYLLRLPPDGPAAVRVAYWGGETRRRVFEVTAEGETIATQSLFDDRPGDLYEVEYPLPERLTRGRDRVRIGFRTGPSQSTGAVFEVRVVRPAGMVGDLAPAEPLVASSAAAAADAPGPRHLIYLHGRIVQEQQSARPHHPRFGDYDLEAILDAFRRQGFAVTGEIRPKAASVGESADRVVEQVRKLIGSGVSPTRITVVGASMGAAIAFLASSRLHEPEVRFCALGACLSENVRRLRAEEGRGPAGRVLSIRESSDDLTEPCAPWEPGLDPGAPVRVREIVLATGLDHGFLYRPLTEWVQPARQWATAP